MAEMGNPRVLVVQSVDLTGLKLLKMQGINQFWEVQASCNFDIKGVNHCAQHTFYLVLSNSCGSQGNNTVKISRQEGKARDCHMVPIYESKGTKCGTIILDVTDTKPGEEF